METTSNALASPPPGTHQVSGALVQQTMREIFESTPFRASKQSRDLLKYIVDQSLAGHAELLKERLIGVNVFGRRPDYDTNEDPIVRARAAEVRKRLAQFYLGEGRHSAIRIEISPGSYLASFTEPFEDPIRALVAVPSAVETPNPEPSAATTSSQVQNAEPKLLEGLASWPAVVILIAIIIAGVIWNHLRTNTPIDAFWKPLIRGPNAVLLYSGANAAYMLSDDFLARYETTHHLDSPETQGREFVVPMSSDVKLEAGDLVGFKNEFVTLGDLSANVRVASFLALHKRRFDLRSGEDIAISDLRQSATVLIGAFNNSLTLELTSDLPFTFDKGRTIKDQLNKKQTWTPVFLPNHKAALDYAIVTRILHARTGEALIAIAGTTGIGTRAAAEFITDPERVKALVQSAPKDWPNKNCQFVIQIKMVNDIPTSPVIVAVRYW